MIDRSDIPLGTVGNEQGQTLTHRSSSGYWEENTYNDRGQILTYQNSLGLQRKWTYNKDGQPLTYTEPGLWEECFYDLGVRVVNSAVYKL